MFFNTMAKRAMLAVRSARTASRRSDRHQRSDRQRPSHLSVATRSGVKMPAVIAAAVALGLLLMVPLAFGSAAYGTQGDCTKIEFNGKQPTTWTSDASYATVTVKAGQVTKTWSNVTAGQTLGPIIREDNGKPIDFSHLVKCLPVATTTTTQAPTTTVPEEVTTTTVPEEVTTTTVPVSEEVTTTTVPEEVTTTTAAPEEVTTTTTPPPTECPHDLELIDGRCVSPSITLDTECWVDGVATVVITNHRGQERPRGIPVEWSYNGSSPVEVVVPPLGTVEVEITGGPVAGTFTVTWAQGTQSRSIAVSDEDCTVVTTTTIPEEVTTTTVPEEVTTTTVPEEVTTTTVPEEETTTTEPSAVPGSTLPPTPDPDPDPVRPVVNARTTSESLPFTGSQHLQLLGMIGIVALAAGLGMIQLVNRRR